LGAFGERMQRERELRGVTLDEISVVTKIGTRSLKALEEEDFDKLPGGIFNKGFVRAYARYLGIDPDEAVADYLAAVESRNGPVGLNAPAIPAPDIERPNLPDFPDTEEPGSSYGGIVTGIVLVGALAVGGWWILSGRGPSLDSIKTLLHRETATEARADQNRPSAQTGVSPAPQAETAPARVSAPAAVQGRAPVLAEVNPALLSPAAKAADQRAASAAAAAAKPAPENQSDAVTTSVSTVPQGTGFTIHVRAAAETWVTITADGKEVTKGLLVPGDERSIHAGRRVIVHVGNAGGVQLAFNGKDLPAIGEQGEVKTLAFGPSGREPYTPPIRPPEGATPLPSANPPNPQ